MKKNKKTIKKPQTKERMSASDLKELINDMETSKAQMARILKVSYISLYTWITERRAIPKWRTDYIKVKLREYSLEEINKFNKILDKVNS